MVDQTIPSPDSSPQKSNSWRKFFLIIGISLIGIFGVGAFLVTLTSFPTYVIRKAIDRHLMGTGIHLIRLDHVNFGRSFLTLEDSEFLVTPDAHRVLVTGVDLTFESWFDLSSGLRSIRINRPHLHINPTPELPDFHVIRKAIRQGFQEMEHLDSFEIQDGLFHFGPYAPMTFEGRFIHRTENNDGHLELKLMPSIVAFPEKSAESSDPLATLQSQAVLTLKKDEDGMSLKINSDHYKIISDEMILDLNDLSLKISDPSSLPLDLPIDIPFTFKMKGIVQGLSLKDVCQLKKPLKVVSFLAPQPAHIDYLLTISDIKKGKDPLLKLEGTYRFPSEESVHEKSKIPPYESLAPKNEDTIRGTISSIPLNVLEWLDLDPLLSKISPGLSLTSGTLKIEGGVHGVFGPVNPETDSFFPGIVPHLTLSLSNINGSSDLFSIKGLSTVLTLNSLFPVISKMNQVMKFSELSLKKINLTDGNIYYSLSPGGNLNLNAVSFKAFGGHIHAREFKYVSQGNLDKGIEFKSDFQDIGVASLVDMADMDSLKADGMVSGNGHFAIDPNGFEIYSASLKNEKPGLIKYRMPAGGLEGDAKMAMNALDNFKYSVLKIDVQGAQDQQNELRAQIHLKGHNPNLLNGYPFEFNINTSGQLRDVIRSAIHSLSEPKSIQELRKMIQ